MTKECRLTTTDNPFDPFEQFTSWYLFDMEKGYDCCGRVDRLVNITDKEWEAIQAGAISDAKLVEILNNTDIDKLRARATPKTRTTLTDSQISRIKTLSSNYTIAEIAKKMGKSPSTISNCLKGVN